MSKRKIYAYSPIGLIEAPEQIAEIIRNESDKELLKNMESHGFIDPFRFSEATRRNLK